jgi:hypothetical protein
VIERSKNTVISTPASTMKRSESIVIFFITITGIRCCRKKMRQQGEC